jgi:hypothetical protein
MNTMFTKTAFGLAVMLAIASGALAATNNHDNTPTHTVYTNVYNPSGAYIGTDPDLNVHLGLKRDWGAGGD